MNQTQADLRQTAKCPTHKQILRTDLPYPRTFSHRPHSETALANPTHTCRETPLRRSAPPPSRLYSTFSLRLTPPECPLQYHSGNCRHPLNPGVPRQQPPQRAPVYCTLITRQTVFVLSAPSLHLQRINSSKWFSEVDTPLYRCGNRCGEVWVDGSGGSAAGIRAVD